MRKVFYAFKPFIIEITHDLMLWACIVGPIIMAIAFRFTIPLLENALCDYFNKIHILSPYYAIFDMLLATMTPILFCFAGVLVILEEIDCGTAKYYSVTPLGRRGYIISRIGIPAILALLYNILLLLFFNLSNISIIMDLLLSFCGVLIATITSMFVITFAKNRIEGMALVKLCGLLIIGIPIAYFVSNPVRYCFCAFPTFWMAESFITGKQIYFVLSIFTAFIMLLILYRKFKKKMM